MNVDILDLDKALIILVKLAAMFLATTSTIYHQR